MKKITLSADARLLAKARLIAKSQNKTLNTVFREWLQSFASEADNVTKFRALMNRLRHINSGGPFTRDEMNER
jgi:hypothetical protein